MAETNRKDLYQQFQAEFPLESLKDMPLEKYTNLNRKDSFCYWVETRTYELGSINGGSAFKFGIYKFINPPKENNIPVEHDDNYAWYSKYSKKSPQEAYEIVRNAIVSIAESASKGEFEAIDNNDVVWEVFKWKIAYLYSNETLIPIYRREMLDMVSSELGMDNPQKKPVSEIQRFLISKKDNKDLYDFYDELLSIMQSKNTQNTFSKLADTVITKLGDDYRFKPSHRGRNFIWICTKDGYMNSNECHYEFCGDSHKKANHQKGKVFVELHCEGNNANSFKSLESIDGIKSFPWEYYGIRKNDEGWMITDYTSEQLADILINELHELDELVADKIMDIIQNETPIKNDCVSLLKDCKNLVLTGAPGTGKTHLAFDIAKEMGATEDTTKFVQFHPSYDYTDFVEGLRPIEKADGQIGFERKDGVFKEFCKLALNQSDDPESALAHFKDDIKYKHISIPYIDSPSKEPFSVSLGENNNIVVNIDGGNNQAATDKNIIESIKEGRRIGQQTYPYCIGAYIKNRYMNGNERPFVFIIDEINRGEASKIFGELFFAIDLGYRGNKENLVQTQYQNLVPLNDVFSKGFYVPENVYILATMNDIDRSVESMDFAMRRRFTWKEIKPIDTEVMLDKELKDEANKAKETMHRLNEAIKETEGLGEAYMVGPSYFIKLKHYQDNYELLWKMNIEPLLKEYLRGFRQAETIRKKFEMAYFNTQAKTPETTEQTE